MHGWVCVPTGAMHDMYRSGVTEAGATFEYHFVFKMLLDKSCHLTFLPVYSLV